MGAFTNYGVHNAFGIEAMVEEELRPGIMLSKPVGGFGVVMVVVVVGLRLGCAAAGHDGQQASGWGAQWGVEVVVVVVVGM